MDSVKGEVVEDDVVCFLIELRNGILFTIVDVPAERSGPVSFARFCWTDEEQGFWSVWAVLMFIKEGIENLLINVSTPNTTSKAAAVARTAQQDNREQGRIGRSGARIFDCLPLAQILCPTSLGLPLGL